MLTLVDEYFFNCFDRLNIDWQSETLCGSLLLSFLEYGNFSNTGISHAGDVTMHEDMLRSSLITSLQSYWQVCR